MYERIAAPLIAGSFQITVTWSFALDHTVTGASGFEGFEAARTDTTEEKSEKSAAVRD